MVPRGGIEPSGFAQAGCVRGSHDTTMAWRTGSNARRGRVPTALPWHDVEVASDEVGAPVFVLRGDAAERVGGHRTHLSLSHDTSVATAFVVIEE